MAANPKIEKVLKELSDLEIQATNEQSHFYTKKVISEARSVIEELLASQIEKGNNTAFRIAWKNLSTEVAKFQKMVSDPFKAPEQTVELIPELMQALWTFQIEWVALNRG